MTTAQAYENRLEREYQAQIAEVPLSQAEFSDTHVEDFMFDFAFGTEMSAEEWLSTVVRIDALGDADGDGTINELLRDLCKGGSYNPTHWQIMKKLARQAYNAGYFK